jgi:hypothetical protein
LKETLRRTRDVTVVSCCNVAKFCGRTNMKHRARQD